MYFHQTFGARIQDGTASIVLTYDDDARVHVYEKSGHVTVSWKGEEGAHASVQMTLKQLRELSEALEAWVEGRRMALMAEARDVA